MPIQVATELTSISEDLFREIAYEVTGIAFRMHNEYGSFFAEKLYKNEIAAECRKLGLSRTEREVEISVTFDSFHKPYYIDLLAGGGALFEFKVASGLNDEHRAQTLNYLFLAGLQRAKLFNLGAPSVQHEFVSTTLTHDERKRFAVDRNRFRPLDAACTRYTELVVDLLNDWGSFLQLPLYYEAVTHFFGGEADVIHKISVVRDGELITDQKVHLLTETTALKITGIPGNLHTIEEHLRRFLHHTQLRSIQWVNIHQHDITFITLQNST